jgi:hypothetical protein
VSAVPNVTTMRPHCAVLGHSLTYCATLMTINVLAWPSTSAVRSSVPAVDKNVTIAKALAASGPGT